jgi:hypothetical protein
LAAQPCAFERSAGRTEQNAAAKRAIADVEPGVEIDDHVEQRHRSDLINGFYARVRCHRLHLDLISRDYISAAAGSAAAANTF